MLDRGNLGKKVGDLSVLKQPPIFDIQWPASNAFPPNIDFILGGGPDPGQGPPLERHHLQRIAGSSDGSHGARLFDWGENESLREWTLHLDLRRSGLRGKGAGNPFPLAGPRSHRGAGRRARSSPRASSGKDNGIVLAAGADPPATRTRSRCVEREPTMPPRSIHFECGWHPKVQPLGIAAIRRDVPFSASSSADGCRRKFIIPKPQRAR